MQHVYDALGLPAFDQTKSAVEAYVRSIDGFQKNQFPELTGVMRRRIAEEWRLCFEQWGYPV